jgi:aminoglycoside phosphotransferase (APT) family kinase protein
VVFDWSNAAVGPPAADVALAWLVGLTATVDGSRWLRFVVATFRRRLIERFVDQAGRAAALAILPAVADYRLADRNNRPEEITRLEALVAALT